jgi:hypothetical protein
MMKTEASESAGFNPYAPPASRVETAPTAGVEPVFFPVGRLKLAVMSVFTLGFYVIYWFYKNWKCVQENFKDKVNAPIRAVFYPIMAYSLFRRIRAHARSAGIEARFPAGILAIAIFLITVPGQIVDRSGLSALLCVLLLLPVQNTVNAINRKLAPGADPNERFSGANIAWIVVGGVLLLFALIGAFAPQ